MMGGCPLHGNLEGPVESCKVATEAKVGPALNAHL